MDKHRLAITVGQPTITPVKTEAIRGDWVTTGTVAFSVVQGASANLGTLEFPYHDAASQQDALLQVLTPLEAVITQLGQAATKLRSALNGAKTNGAVDQSAEVAAVATAAS